MTVSITLYGSQLTFHMMNVKRIGIWKKICSNRSLIFVHSIVLFLSSTEIVSNWSIVFYWFLWLRLITSWPHEHVNYFFNLTSCKYITMLMHSTNIIKLPFYVTSDGTIIKSKIYSTSISEGYVLLRPVSCSTFKFLPLFFWNVFCIIKIYCIVFSEYPAPY